MGFKVGDRVRRTGWSISSRGSRQPINHGDVVEITSVNSFNGEDYLRFFGENMGYNSDDFEHVQSEPTDQELADEYRAGIARSREIRAILKDRGFILMLGGLTPPVALDTNPPEKYYFKKVVEEKL